MEDTIQPDQEIETQIDILVKDIVEITSELLEQYARDQGEESLKVVRVS